MHAFCFFLALLCCCSQAACKKTAPVAADAPAAANPEVVFETNQGSFTVRLFADKSPESSRNMLAYVDSGFYNGTIFHRIIPEYVVQGGGFDKDLQLKPTQPPIKNEADNGLSNRRATVAMARTNVVNSATAQFFINVRDNPKLDHSPNDFGYAVVGEVIDGMAVVDLMRNLPTRCPSWTGQPCKENLPPGMRDIPIEPVIIQSAHRK